MLEKTTIAGARPAALAKELRAAEPELRLAHVLLEGKRGIDKLLQKQVPPILIYDHRFLYTGERGEPRHAVVAVDSTAETITVQDPSREKKVIFTYAVKEFLPAWEVTYRHALILHPESMKLRMTSVRELKGEKPLEEFGAGREVEGQ